MRGRLSTHLRDNIVSYLALFCFATTGTAHAVDGPLDGQNTVGSVDIIDSEVTSADIGTGNVAGIDVANQTIQPVKVADGTLISTDVAAGSLADAQIDESAIFNDNSLTTADVDDASLFNDDSLNSTDLALNSINGSEIAPRAVGSSEVSSITGADIAADSADADEIAASAVGSSELKSPTVESVDGQLAPFSSGELLVACPSPSLAIGGSGGSPTHEVRINSSFPSESRTSVNFPETGDQFSAWWVRFQNTGGFPHFVSAYVICMPV